MQIMQVTWMTSQQRIAGTDHSMFHSTRWTVRGKHFGNVLRINICQSPQLSIRSCQAVFIVSATGVMRATVMSMYMQLCNSHIRCMRVMGNTLSWPTLLVFMNMGS